MGEGNDVSPEVQRQRAQRGIQRRPDWLVSSGGVSGDPRTVTRREAGIAAGGAALAGAAVVGGALGWTDKIGDFFDRYVWHRQKKEPQTPITINQNASLESEIFKSHGVDLSKGPDRFTPPPAPTAQPTPPSAAKLPVMTEAKTGQ